MTQELLIILFLILLNGVFALSEISIVSSKKIKLEGKAKKGSIGAKTALALAEDPTRILSTVQVGITLIGILTGFFSGGSFAIWIQQSLVALGVPAHYADNASVAVVVGLITYFSLILGELVPKKIGLQNPEAIATVMAVPVNILSKVAAPAVWLLTVSTNLILKILPISSKSGDEVTEEEVKSLIAQGTTTGTFEEIERSIVERVFHFSDRRIGSLMTNRNQVDWVDVTEPALEIVRALASSNHSHILVCRDELDEIVGVLPVKPTFQHMLAKSEELTEADIQALLQPPLFLPDAMGVLKALDKLQDKQAHLAVVVNEFGALLGVVTFSDILQGLLASRSDESNPDVVTAKGIVQRPDGSVLVDGTFSYAEFFNAFDVATPKNEDLSDAGFHTMAGLFLYANKQIPTAGDSVTFGNLRLEVVDMDGNRIDKLLITFIDREEEIVIND